MYATCCNEKPPFNYAQIIGINIHLDCQSLLIYRKLSVLCLAMAMLEHGRMTLQGICKWIQERFAYYKTHKNWNVRIRRQIIDP